jgi:hypothetical protein
MGIAVRLVLGMDNSSGVFRFIRLSEISTMFRTVKPISCLFVGITSLFIASLFTVESEAKTITAKTSSHSDVQGAIHSAQNGDTIIVPAGSATWSSTLVTNKAVTLRGAGIDRTIITRSSGNTIKMTGGHGNKVRVSGFTFKGGGVYLEGEIHGFRIDNNKFLESTGHFSDAGAIEISGYIDGVVDHNVFLNHRSIYGIVVYGDNDKAWSRPQELGKSDGVVFVEDNVFTYNKCGSSDPPLPRHSIASNRGARYVFRYNKIDTCSSANHLLDAPIDVHGNCFFGRGGVSFEIYGNTVHSTRSWACMQLRGGTGVVFNNRLTGTFTHQILLNNYRSFSDSCGTGPRCTRYPCPDQINELYIWNNTYNGGAAGITINSAGSVRDHIREGRDFFLLKKAGYTPYAYPHPLTGEVPAVPSRPSNLKLSQ